MPLQEQLIEVPIVGGVDEGNSPKVSARLMSARNCVYRKPGELWKRYGVAKFAGTNARNTVGASAYQPSATPPVCETLIANGSELIRIGGGQLDVYSPVGTTSDWVYKGRVSECSVSIGTSRPTNQTAFGTATRPDPIDPVFAYDGARYSATAWVGSDAFGNDAVFFDLRDESNGTMIMSGVPGSSGTAHHFSQPRVVFCGGYLVVAFLGNNGGIYYRRVNMTTLAIDVADYTMASPTGGSGQINLFDLVAYSSTEVAVAISSVAANAVQALGYNIAAQTGTTIATIYTYGSLYNCQSVAVDGIAADGQIWALAGIAPSTAPYTAKLVYCTASLTASTCTTIGTAVSSSILAPATPSNALFYNCSVRRTSATTALICANQKDPAQQNAQDFMWWNEVSRVGSTDYITYNPSRMLLNSQFISQPFLQGGSAYAWCTIDNPRATTHFLVDLSLGTQMPFNPTFNATLNGSPRIVAVSLPEQYRGIVVQLDWLRGYGLSPVVQTSSTTWSMATLRGLGQAFQPTLVRLDTSFAAGTRNAAVIGQTLVVSGGCVMAYDGTSTFEIGFAASPNVQLAGTTATSGGMTTGATYGYQMCWSWRDAKGDMHRGIFSNTSSVVMAGGRTSAKVLVDPLQLTNRNTPVQLSVYRTLANGSTYYLVGSVQNAINAQSIEFDDSLSDAAILAAPKEHSQAPAQIGVASGIPQNVIPPSCTNVHFHENRVWLSGIDDDSLWFSPVKQVGTGLSFSDSFTFDAFGNTRNVATGTLDEKLIIFKKNQCYGLVGEGPDPTNTTGAFSTISTLQAALGCIEPRSIVPWDEGIAFLSATGLVVLSRGLIIVQTGKYIENTLGGQSIVAASYVSQNNAVRFVGSPDPTLTRGIVFEYDTKSGTIDNPQWTTHDYPDIIFANYTIVAATTQNNVWTFINSAGYAFRETTGFIDTFPGTQYVPMSGQLSWVHGAGKNGTERVWYVALLGEYQDPHDINVSVYTDYSVTPDQTALWTSDTLGYGTNASLPEQLRMHVVKQECSAISVAFSQVVPSTVSPITGKGCIITGISLEIGVESASRKVPAARSR